MDSLASIKHNKNLLRVAAEIAGKGNSEGNDKGFDDIENIAPNKEETAEVSETVDAAPEVNETVQAFTDLVVKQLQVLEETLEDELVDENLDFAINTIIDNLISKN